MGPRAARDLRRPCRCPAARSPTPPATWARCHTLPGRSSCRCAHVASTSRRRSPVPDASSRGLAKATYGTGVFVLAHAGDERPEPAGGLLPTVAWRVDGRVEWALDGGVFTAGALLEWLSRRTRPRRRPGCARGSRCGAPRTPAGSGCCRRWPGIGAPWWRPDARAVIAGLASRPAARPDRICGARGDRVAGRRRRSPRCASRSRSRSCASTAVSTRSEHAALAAGRRRRSQRPARQRRRDRGRSRRARRGRRRSLGSTGRDRELMSRSASASSHARDRRLARACARRVARFVRARRRSLIGASTPPGSRSLPDRAASNEAGEDVLGASRCVGGSATRRLRRRACATDATSSRCWAFDRVSTSSGWAMRAISSLICPCTSVISVTSRG